MNNNYNDSLCINEIGGMSKLDVKIIDRVLRATVIAILLEVFAEKDEFILPFLFKMKFKYNDVLSSDGRGTDLVFYDFEPQYDFITEAICINDKKITPVEQTFKDRMLQNPENIPIEAINKKGVSV